MIEPDRSEGFRSGDTAIIVRQEAEDFCPRVCYNEINKPQYLTFIQRVDDVRIDLLLRKKGDE